MHARDLHVPLPGDEPAAPIRQPPSSEVLGAARRLPVRALDGLCTELAGVADDPGAIEYASWIRLLQPRRA